MPATALLNPKQQFFDDNGDPLSGGFLYTYSAGTSTPVATYTDSDLLVANANPIVLDAAGRCVVYLKPALGAIKCILQDADAVQLWSQDNISPAQVAS